jgi:hypothetical protein
MSNLLQGEEGAHSNPLASSISFPLCLCVYYGFFFAGRRGISSRAPEIASISAKRVLLRSQTTFVKMEFAKRRRYVSIFSCERDCLQRHREIRAKTVLV